jgi:hypothetical protein
MKRQSCPNLPAAPQCFTTAALCYRGRPDSGSAYFLTDTPTEGLLTALSAR